MGGDGEDESGRMRWVRNSGTCQLMWLDKHNLLVLLLWLLVAAEAEVVVCCGAMGTLSSSSSGGCLYSGLLCSVLDPGAARALSFRPRGSWSSEF